MGWRFRRSFKMGPIRWNLSRGGIGGSWGGPGFRVGVSADGRRYLSVGISGTGLYYQHYFGRNRSGTPGGSPTAPSSSGSASPDLPSLSPPAPTPVVLSPVVPSNSRRACLLVKRDGLTTGQRFDIADRAVVGRADAPASCVDVDLAAMPEAAYVSARHAEIHYEPARGWLIRDLGSQNGSFVRPVGTNDFRRIAGEEALREGDEVAFGNARLESHTV